MWCIWQYFFYNLLVLILWPFKLHTCITVLQQKTQQSYHSPNQEGPWKIQADMTNESCFFFFSIYSQPWRHQRNTLFLQVLYHKIAEDLLSIQYIRGLETYNFNFKKSWGKFVRSYNTFACLFGYLPPKKVCSQEATFKEFLTSSNH